ncbi:MMPL family transporter [Tatumella sp. UBA2305]|uniref:MMPL family transporter n=1 Tax=Tatumella sp. UBA2305 TaxID=1947647 RepID=UPI002600823A|nr:MMPL family transporter [Tatumella sp. UBA2305]
MKSLKLSNPLLRAISWLIVCCGLVIILLLQLPQSRINSSVLSLLPGVVSDEVPPALSDAFMQRLDRQVVWLVSAGQQDDPSVADAWLNKVSRLPQLAHVSGPMSEQDQQRWGSYFYQHRNANLDPDTRTRLADHGQAQIEWITSQIYSAFSGVSGKELQNDPLMLVRGAQFYLSGQGSHLSLKKGWLTVQDKQGKQWYFIHGELRGDSFDMQQTHLLVQNLELLKQQLLQQFPGATVLARSASFYSDHASQQAKYDMSHLGVTTIVAVLLLILWVFRSLKPLALCLLSVGTGALAGTCSVLLIWHELHLMTLVMSLSIIGISADYTLYYLTERMVHGAVSTPWESLRKVGRTLLLALLTTAAAYAIMLLAPFPGIRQMAVFSIAGLTGSCLTVLCCHPWLSRHLPVRSMPFTSFFFRWLAAWRYRKSVRYGIPLLLMILSVIGISRLHVSDDIAQLQSLPAGLVAQEKMITGLTQQGSDQKWFLVYGPDQQTTLQRLEAFLPALNKAKQNKLVAKWRSIPLNSLQQQQQDLESIRKAAPEVTKALTELGIPDVHVDLNAMSVTPEQWLESPASEGWRLLWLSLPDGLSGTLIPVEGVTDSAALNNLAMQFEGVSWVDRKARFDYLFSTYRHLISGLILLALGIVIIGAILRLGIKRGAVSVVPSIISLACGLASLAITGQPVTLFSILALNLVLGIGINYTLFFSNPRGTALTSLQAITLAMITTLLTMGMLVFSSTQAISNFGTVLCSGIFSAWLVSPLAMYERRKRKKNA